MIDLPKNKKIILFDGICNLCNNAVLKVIKNDYKNIFMFASLQSEAGKEIINYLNIDILKIDSIVLFDPGVSYDIKSSAALKIMSEFKGFWNLTTIGWIFPLSIRDFVYDYVAKNRYQWFGKKENCMIPTPELKSKFLS